MVTRGTEKSMAGQECILVVDDDQYVRSSLISILKTADFEVMESDTVEKSIACLETEFVGLIILDIKLPGRSGFDLLDHVRENYPTIETILVSAYADFEMATTAMEKGAYDFIAKPFHAYNVLMAVRRAMEKRNLLLQSRDLQGNLEKKIKEQALAVRIHGEEKIQLLNNMIMSFVHTLEAKDKYTEGHSRRVADNALLIAQRLGLSPREQEDIHLAGLFHDIGKIGIQESVLNKDGKLTAEEYDTIKTHVMIGVKILGQIPQFNRITRMVRAHHEFFDGTGYPDGVQGMQIPIGGRILSICDAYDAMTSDRPYRKKLSMDQAASILIRNRGTQFDHKLVGVWLRCIGYEQAS